MEELYSLDEVRGLTLEFNENVYRLIISETVQGQLRDVKDYISANYFSEQAGANTVKNILYGLERLEVFLKQDLMLMKE